MYCELCMYYTEAGDCSLHGRLDPETKRRGCESYVEMPMRLGRSAGCCGLSGLPTSEPADEPQEDS